MNKRVVCGVKGTRTDTSARQAVEVPGSTSKSNLFWERLRSRFLLGSDRAASSDDDPRRRGIAITICILISCVLWFTFTMQEEYQVPLELPTRVVNLDGEQALTRLPDSTVAVNVLGEGFQLLRLYWDRPTVTIDATRDQLNLRDLVQRELPKNVAVGSVTPIEIVLEKNPRITRKVPVRLNARIDTPPTHELLAPPRIEPDSVEVSGASSVVSRISYWPTQYFERVNLKDSLSIRVSLSDTLSGLITPRTDHVQVTAVARQFTTDTRDIDVTVTGLPPNDRVTLDPDVIKVRYKVPLSQYTEAKQAPDFYAEVSYEDIINDDDHRVTPELHLPPDLDIRDVVMIPSTLRYYLRINN